MARVVLHVGTHKTGSTAVQDAFAANRRLLAHHGVAYPELTRGVAAHHGLAAPWNPDLARYEPRGGAQAAWRALVRRHRDGNGVLLLSSEEFSRAQGPGAMDYGALREALSGFERVDVLLLLRDQVSFLQSAYLQVAKISARPDLRDMPLPSWSRFLDRALRTGTATGLALDYNALLDPLEAAFGAGRVHVLPYAGAAGRAGGAVGLVLERLGCGPDPAALSMPEDGRLNVTGDPLSVWAAAQVSAPRRPPDALVAAVGAVVSERFGPRTTLYTPAEMRAVRQRFAPANERLVGRLVGRRPGFALPWARYPGAARRGRLDRAFWIEVARRLHSAA